MRIAHLAMALCACLLGSACSEEPLVGDDTADDDASEADACAGIDDLTDPVYLAFVIHNEEDDAGCIPASADHIPDYNGDPAVYAHFATAMLDYATMLAGHAATLSFQPDWTFIEGVETFQPDYFEQLLALGNVEIVPHGHESCVMYDEIHDRLAALNADPVMLLGGMTFDEYATRQTWFDDHPGFTFWDAPSVTEGHTDDMPMPPVVYRVPEPQDVAVNTDLYQHVAASPVIVTPDLQFRLDFLASKPAGRYLVPSWKFEATRWFLADPDDLSVPDEWRKDPDPEPGSGDNLTATERIARIEAELISEILPLVDQGLVVVTQAAGITDLYVQPEACLDLADGDDLEGLR